LTSCICGLGVFELKVEEPKTIAQTAIFANIKPVRSILAEEILAWFKVLKILRTFWLYLIGF
jgi:hypothetical protein